MKKIITLLCVAFFILVSCSSNEDSPITVPSATTAQAVLNGGSINVSWPAVLGVGITYNVYRNDKTEKINNTPLTEAKFTDVLTTTGTYTYSITVNSSGLESPKGTASEKVVLELPKTRIIETYDDENYRKTEQTYVYDTSNIAKLVSIVSKGAVTKLSDQTVTISNSKVEFVYTGDLITKRIYYTNNVEKYSDEYFYNTKNQMVSYKRISSTTGNVFFTVFYAYNDNGTITETDDSGGAKYTYTYLNGNIVKDVGVYVLSDSLTSTTTKNSFYDTMNTFYKDIFAYSAIFMSTINNEVSSSESSGNETNSYTTSEKSEYTYNTNNYPLTRTVYNTTPSAEKLIEKTVYTYN